MIKFLGLILSLFIALPASAQDWHPSWASVRIKSHGGSGTIIWSGPGKSLILSCAHMIPNAEDRRRSFRSDGVQQPNVRKASVKLLKWDYDADLSLWEMDNGPLHATPVAPAGHRPGKNVLSIGFDNLTWPVTQRKATLIGTSGDITWTVESPWHGRSGGGLIDLDHKVLIGVVMGYQTYPEKKGMYVSHAAILRFLGQEPVPQTHPRHHPQPFAPQPRIALPSPRPGGC